MTSVLWNSIPTDWQSCLDPLRSQIEHIDDLIMQSEAGGSKVTPGLENVFAALQVLPSEVSVVLLGQDPYPSADHGTGLAFAVPKNTYPLPGSLRNIFKEIASDIKRESVADSTLSKWVDQGVLLLNTSLTTQSGFRGAHAAWPWDPIVRAILAYAVEVNPSVVALLWGNHAKGFSDLFDPDSVVTSAHPSPLSASRGFLGSKPFSRANEILAANAKPGIAW